jgi:von Willebrand factor type A domain
LSAFDEHWRPIDLRPEQLRLMIGHDQVKIDSLKRLSRTPRIVFVLDGSGSMAGIHQRRWVVALQTAMDVVSTAPGGTQFGVVTIGGPGERGFELTTDKKSTLELIRSFEKAGGTGRTALYDGIARAVSMLQPSAPGDAIFLLTDGGDNDSKIARSQLIREVDSAHVTALGVLFEDDQYRTPEETSGGNDVRDLVERTGGELYRVSDDTLRINGVPSVIGVLRSMLPVWDALLYHPYMVEVQAQEKKTQSVRVSLVHSEMAPKSARLAYRPKLPACSNMQQLATGK